MVIHVHACIYIYIFMCVCIAGHSLAYRQALSKPCTRATKYPSIKYKTQLPPHEDHRTLSRGAFVVYVDGCEFLNAVFHLVPGADSRTAAAEPGVVCSSTYGIKDRQEPAFDSCVSLMLACILWFVEGAEAFLRLMWAQDHT